MKKKLKAIKDLVYNNPRANREFPDNPDTKFTSKELDSRMLYGSNTTNKNIIEGEI